MPTAGSKPPSPVLKVTNLADKRLEMLASYAAFINLFLKATLDLAQQRFPAGSGGVVVAPRVITKTLIFVMTGAGSLAWLVDRPYDVVSIIGNQVGSFTLSVTGKTVVQTLGQAVYTDLIAGRCTAPTTILRHPIETGQVLTLDQTQGAFQLGVVLEYSI
jgi:hypothetical protein